MLASALVLGAVSPVSLKLRVLLPEPPLMERVAVMFSSTPELEGAVEEIVIVSFPPPELTLVGPEIA